MSENIPTLETLDTSPFKRLVLSFGAVPTDFKDSMTYYELLSWLCNYLEKQVLPTVNATIEKYDELITAFNTLKDYVDNYFENLDVQEEINNKLDEMAESGELGPIIAEYFDHAVIVRDTVSTLKADESLTSEGLTIKTLGYSSINDGGGAYYVTRTKTESDVEDNGSILFLQNNLVGVLQNTNGTVNIKQFGGKGDNLTDNASAINNAIAYIKANPTTLSTLFFPVGKYLVNSTINNIDFPIKIKGESPSNVSNVASHGCVIMDTRNNDNPLLNFVAISSDYAEGTQISDIEFFATGETPKNCLRFTKYSAWELYLTNVTIENYLGNAIFFDETNDAFIQNCSILACGSYTEGQAYYAVEEGGNSHHWDNCHFEHCPFPLHERSTSFDNKYISVKFENGQALPYKSSSTNPILLEGSKGSVFLGCLFTFGSSTRYYEYYPSIAPGDLPYFMRITVEEPYIISNCQFQGTLASNAPDTIPSNRVEVKWLRTLSNAIVTGNTFRSTIVSTYGFNLTRTTFKDNVIIGSARDYTGFAPLEDVVSPTITGTESNISGNMFFMSNAISTKVMPCVTGSRNVINNNFIRSTTRSLLTNSFDSQYLSKSRYQAQELYSNYPYQALQIKSERFNTPTNTTANYYDNYSVRLSASGNPSTYWQFACNTATTGTVHFKYQVPVNVDVYAVNSGGETKIGTLTGDNTIRELTASASVSNITSIRFYVSGVMSSGNRLQLWDPYIA